MCETCDHRKNTNRTYAIIIVVLFVLIGAMAVLVARFSHLLNNAYDLQQQNHVIACHIDETVSNGERIYECRDVPLGNPNGGGK